MQLRNAMCRLLTINCIYGGTIVINSADLECAEREPSHFLLVLPRSVVQWRIGPLLSRMMHPDKASGQTVLPPRIFKDAFGCLVRGEYYRRNDYSQPTALRESWSCM